MYLTQKKRNKLREAWKWGLTDKQAASHASMTYSQLQRYLAEDEELDTWRKSYKDRQAIRNQITARKNIASELSKGDVRTSRWYLEKTSEEFQTKSQVQVGGTIDVAVEDKEQALKKFMEQFGNE